MSTAPRKNTPNLLDHGRSTLADMDRQLAELRNSVLAQRATKVPGKGTIWTGAQRKPLGNVNAPSSAPKPPLKAPTALPPPLPSATTTTIDGMSATTQKLLQGIHSFDVLRGDFIMMKEPEKVPEEDPTIQQYLTRAKKGCSKPFSRIEEYQYNETHHEDRDEGPEKNQAEAVCFCVECHKVVSVTDLMCPHCGKRTRVLEEFDENAAAREFQEALLAWRNSGTTQAPSLPRQRAQQPLVTTTSSVSDAAQTPDHQKGFLKNAKDCNRYWYFGVLMRQYHNNMTSSVEKNEEEIEPAGKKVVEEEDSSKEEESEDGLPEEDN